MAATMPISRSVGTPSNILISTVPKSGCGRISHHTSLMLRIVPARRSVSMYSSNSLQSASGCGGPEVGSPPKITARLDAEPLVVPAPERARRCQPQEMRQVRSERIDDGNRLVPVADAHVDVHPECLDP